MLGQKNVAPKKFWVQKVMGLQKFGVKKNFGNKKNLGSTKFWVQKFLCAKKCGIQKNFGCKKCGIQKFWVQKRFWVQKNFWSKNISGPNNLGARKVRVQVWSKFAFY